MTDEEADAFLEETRTLALCSIDHRGYPHAVGMWFCRIDGLVHMTTFRKAQKVVNLRRDPKSALLAESGDRYGELRGLLLRGRTEVVDDLELCLDVLQRIHQRMEGGERPGLDDALRSQASKRVVLRFRPERASSWDHRKLGGGR
ncbi:MAG: hypothetical protein QOD06_564 [Candidatus Binatota bacterium]|nr:hypothetical protein [Candidatus Binatota bacterium]